MIMVISPLLSKWGGAGDERLFAGAEGLLQRHRLSGLEHPREPRSIMPVATISCMLLPSTSSRRRPETSS